MNKELIKKHLVSISPFDTARNVYYLIVLSKELKIDYEKLVDRIGTVQLSSPTDKTFAKNLFDALIDCSSPDEQVNLLDHFFTYVEKGKTPFKALALSLNCIENVIR